MFRNELIESTITNPDKTNNMKKIQLIPALLMAFLMIGQLAVASENPLIKKKVITMPENVKKVIDNSCFGCHNTDSRNDDAKEELDFKTLDQLTATQKLGALKHIRETIEENEMPPKKFLEHKPEKALTQAQKELLINWVKQESTALLKK